MVPGRPWSACMAPLDEDRRVDGRTPAGTLPSLRPRQPRSWNNPQLAGSHRLHTAADIKSGNPERRGSWPIEDERLLWDVRRRDRRSGADCMLIDGDMRSGTFGAKVAAHRCRARKKTTTTSELCSPRAVLSCKANSEVNAYDGVCVDVVCVDVVCVDADTTARGHLTGVSISKQHHRTLLLLPPRTADSFVNLDCPTDSREVVQPLSVIMSVIVLRVPWYSGVVASDTAVLRPYYGTATVSVIQCCLRVSGFRIDVRSPQSAAGPPQCGVSPRPRATRHRHSRLRCRQPTGHTTRSTACMHACAHRTRSGTARCRAVCHAARCTCAWLPRLA